MKNILIQVTLTYDNDTQSYQTHADWSEDRISFKDPNGEEHIYQKSSETIRLVKHGITHLEFTFSHLKTKGLYRIDTQTFQFDIKTQKLLFQNTQLNIQYDLIQNNEVISTHLIDIKRLT
jgi:uncharacterized beta-barrel protein YwiB (DUF1934 family)